MSRSNERMAAFWQSEVISAPLKPSVMSATVSGVNSSPNGIFFDKILNISILPS